MQCEGDKVYDKSGYCPVCRMNLVNEPKEKKEIKDEVHNHLIQKSDNISEGKYYCPMHCGDKVYNNPGNCPVCRMN